MNDMQRATDEWASQWKDKYWRPHEILARLMEEVGELSREINHRWGPKKKKATEDMCEMEEEIGDILFTIACLTNSLGMDMDECFTKAMKKYTERDASRFEKK